MSEHEGRLTPEELQALTEGMGNHPELEARPIEFTELDGNLPDRQVSSDIDFLWDLPMNVEVILGHTDLSVQDVLDIGPGSVVELERAYGEPVDVYLNDRLVAKGEVVIVGEQFGVKITEILASFPEDGEKPSE
ncbi:MAG: flagellar motor switch protein FliN [Firmicutes bacterium]|uniref:Flagellar motor switch protein FliN n=1 Tax=Sulfobacillus benefaciens TaxID=453960 RepID=A0A2T2X6K3_9FIRM|nr:flagellar motor switch protein FliN [Bacillota bacterium]MCL5015710.1 flagellar motor switch protein FliN [Bacillota bacterium]PSR30133.1 MAG: flagellar motor switch protein FliN [Sulfobacillus benefaciens]HBQ95334.1 flagellar motor switch protein FliN [Sulfobacillus sp.]